LYCDYLLFIKQYHNIKTFLSGKNPFPQKQESIWTKKLTKEERKAFETMLAQQFGIKKKK
jgi:hypothetical protein